MSIEFATWQICPENLYELEDKIMGKSVGKACAQESNNLSGDSGNREFLRNGPLVGDVVRFAEENINAR